MIQKTDFYRPQPPLGGTQMLQNPFYLFFTACLGLFFWAGYRRIFAEVPYRHSLWSFLGEECAPGSAAPSCAPFWRSSPATAAPWPGY